LHIEPAFEWRHIACGLLWNGSSAFHKAVNIGIMESMKTIMERESEVLETLGRPLPAMESEAKAGSPR